MEEQSRWYPPQTPRFYLQLSVYWFALSLLWGGLITIVMQHRIAEMDKLHKDYYLGLALALGALVCTLVCLVVGTMSDRSHWRIGKRRPYIVVGTLVALPFLLLLATANTLFSLIVIFCLVQFTVNIATSPYQAMIPDLVPREHQGTASAFMGMSTLIGTMGGLALCGYLITQNHLIWSGVRLPNGLMLIMITLAIFLLFSMLFTIWKIPERPAADEQRPVLNFFATIVDSFRISPREHPDFFWLIASRFFINVGFYTATEFLSYYIADTLHAPDPDTTVAQLFLLTTFAGLIGNFPAGILSDRMSKKRVVYISNSITAVAALIFILTHSLTVAFCAAFVFGVGYGAFQAVDWALATNLLPERDEAKFMGLWQAAFTVPQIVAPAIGGLVGGYFNSVAELHKSAHLHHGDGYRVVLFLVLIYLGIGSVLIHPIRERQWTPAADGIEPARG